MEPALSYLRVFHSETVGRRETRDWGVGYCCMVLASRVLRKCSLPSAVRLEAQRETVSHCPEAQHFLLLLITVSCGGLLVGSVWCSGPPPGGLGLKVKCSGLKAIKDSPLHVLETRN